MVPQAEIASCKHSTRVREEIKREFRVKFVFVKTLLRIKYGYVKVLDGNLCVVQ